MKIISSYYKWLKFSYQSFYLVHLIKNTMKTILLLFLFPILMNDSLLFDFNKKTNSSEWKIIDDGVESLTIRTSGQWVNGNSGSNESFTLHMTRVGP